MQRKTVVITGANSGIGLALACELAARGARVCMACRDQDRASRARDAILLETPGAEVELYQLDLASFASIRRFAGDFTGKHPVLDALVNNAGAYPATKRLTEDGFELMFGGNTLGPVLLTHLLLGPLEAAEDGRCVHLSSTTHLAGKIDFDSFRGQKPYSAFRAYAQSKLGNVLFSNAMARRTTVANNAVHPGGVDSPFYREWPKAMYAMLKPFLIVPRRAAMFTADLAIAPQRRGITGRYFAVQPPRLCSRPARDAALQDRLYDETCGLVGIEPLERLAHGG